MYDKEVEPFSNPLAPPSQMMDRKEAPKEVISSADTQPLTNDDFRKLMMTPRVGFSSAISSGMASVRESSRGQRPKSVLKSDLNENRKKKKKFYATLKRQEEDTLSELAKRYRDRARERRDGDNPDYTHETETSMASTAAYRAVAPDLKSGLDAAERRKQVIQESKFLGGDMEHTHLVKGLDYALLHKVKAEITSKERDVNDDEINDKEDEEELALEVSMKNTSVSDIAEEIEDPFALKSKFAKNISNILFNRQIPERNELFLTGRMAYVVDLEDEFPDSDIPTTVIRSKADCPNMESMTSMSTNDIVINKLTQILSYLRQGGANRRNKKLKEKIPFIGDESLKRNDNKNSNKSSKGSKSEDNIYEDVGDYVPELKRRDRSDRERGRDRDKGRDHRERDHNRDKDRNRDKHSRNYFDKSNREEHDSRRNEIRDAKSIAISGITGTGSTSSAIQFRSKGTKLDQEMPESYAECYPGAPENDDAVLDSDDEVDYSKMDLGNRKGLIGRWDFDTAEEYGDYMSHKEALPKAAFQYGVKMADGRKTRRGVGKKDEKVKLDRDLQKINAILARRKAEGTEPFGATPVEHKKQKMH